MKQYLYLYLSTA